MQAINGKYLKDIEWMIPTLDQLFFLRPTPGWANYRTPIRNYYQCGSGTHPGGGITGAPGRLAAREILGGTL